MSWLFVLDDRIAVSATSIPTHLEQMIEILEQEEHDSGPTVGNLKVFVRHDSDLKAFRQKQSY